MTQTKTKKPRHRTYARNRALTAKLRTPIIESDGQYLLKLAVIIVLGAFWLKLSAPLNWNGFIIGGFPIGCIVGLVGIHLWEKNQLDRKIWYAILILVTIIGNFFPATIMV